MATTAEETEKMSSAAAGRSRVYLPKLAAEDRPTTILEFLCAHFPQVPRETWIDRMHRGKVLGPDEVAIHEATPYRHGLMLTYFREVPVEDEIPFAEQILFQDEHLLVADKPHFLPVTPSGQAVNECLLSRLQRRTGIEDLAPLHRLDRDTAGLVLFSKVPSERELYGKLFAEGKVVRKYVAIARVSREIAEAETREWTVRDRLVPEAGSFRMRRAVGAGAAAPEGPANACTRIVLRETRLLEEQPLAGNELLGLFDLFPETGKKHQLRLHMASLGFPILNDPFYPGLQPPPPQDYSRPMQLLATHLGFKDLITGVDVTFDSRRELACWSRSSCGAHKKAALQTGGPG